RVIGGASFGVRSGRRRRGRMRHREAVGLCLALAACAGRSTIGGGSGSHRDGGAAASATPAGTTTGLASSVAPPEGETCGQVPCGAGESCCLTTLACFDPVADPDACPRPSDVTPAHDLALGGA